MKEPAKQTPPDWTEMYRLELGIDPSDRHQLLNAVTKDIAARHGDTAAKRRVAAYYRAQRALEKEVAAKEREAAKQAREKGDVLPVNPWAAEAKADEEEEDDEA
jgi:hypothetical protein